MTTRQYVVALVRWCIYTYRYIYGDFSFSQCKCKFMPILVWLSFRLYEGEFDTTILPSQTHLTGCYITYRANNIFVNTLKLNKKEKNNSLPTWFFLTARTNILKRGNWVVQPYTKGIYTKERKKIYHLPLHNPTQTQWIYDVHNHLFTT